MNKVHIKSDIAALLIMNTPGAAGRVSYHNDKVSDVLRDLAIKPCSLLAVPQKCDNLKFIHIASHERMVVGSQISCVMNNSH